MSQLDLLSFYPAAPPPVPIEPLPAIAEEAEEGGQLEAERAAGGSPDQLLLLDVEETWRREWKGMPEFSQEDLSPYKSILVHFETRADVERFAELVGQKLVTAVDGHQRYTQSIWYPEAEIGRFANKRYAASDPEKAIPRYPIYVPTKGRWEGLLTIKALEKIGVAYKAVVEEQERDDYVRAGVDPAKILVLPHRDKGLVVTRNWIWDHALASGAHRFWTMDDNIQGFYRLNRNLKTPVTDGSILRAIEDFIERYENVPIAGMNYFMFAPRKEAVPALYLNTRVYSNMLILTDARDAEGRPYRNEGFYNDDTDLCLRVLKDGWCTVLFNAFLILKQTTMTVKGGMTPYYQGDGRRRMAEELRDKHPDVVDVAWKWGRWQHQVDYSPFRRNALRRKAGVGASDGVDDYGMVLQEKVGDRWEGIGLAAPDPGRF